MRPITRRAPLLMALTSVVALCSVAATPGYGGVRAMAGVQRQDFGKTDDGTPVDLYVLTNAGGSVAKIMTYGAIVTELHVPDRNGKMGDVVLGFDNLGQYLKGHPFFGAIAGRYANRIAKGKFTLDGKEYTLAVNNGPNSLHGGIKGFDKKVWKAEVVANGDGPSVQFSTLSPDGDEGYPGSLNVTVTYTLTDKNELRIDYTATTDKPTVLNITNHSYFNLKGSGDVLDHEMRLYANQYTVPDDTLIPTGEIKPVNGTPLDFTQTHLIGTRIKQIPASIGGYDHNFVINGGGRSLTPAARVYEHSTGRVMDVLTTEPGVQFYTGNFLDGSLKGKGGVTYGKHAGFCLETQHYPDSPNKPNFPTTVLRPGQTFRSTTVYRFSTQ